MNWTRPGFERALDDLLASLDPGSWPDPPPGFSAVLPARPMRVVLHGTVTGDGGAVEVALKWSRPVTRTDRIARRLRGGKGAREGQVLRVLEDADVPAVRAIAYADDDADVLLTRWEPGLVPLETTDGLDPNELLAVARVVRGMHAAGVRHADLHAGNVAWGRGGPLLLDLGSARSGQPVPDSGDPAVLARLAHGLLGGTRRTQRVRALRAWCSATGIPDAEVRALVPLVEARWQAIHRKFLRGRDRRATREGRHFHLFETPTASRCIRNLDLTDPTWERAVDAWLDHRDEGGGGASLKSDDRVRRVPGPLDGAVDQVVVKHYAPISRGRLPRPIHAFRIGEALTTRGVAVPRPLLAATRGDGSGILVSEWIDAPDLHAFHASEEFMGMPRDVRSAVLRHLGRTLRLMHDAEVSHRDLKAPNLLVTIAPEPRVWVADLDGASLRGRPVSWARRAKDLARLDASLGASRTDRLRVFSAYMNVPPWPRTDPRRLLAGIAHHVARKRGLPNRPR